MSHESYSESVKEVEKAVLVGLLCLKTFSSRMQTFYKTRGTDEQVRPISNKNLGKISPAALEL
jgi:hypothetical protein